MAGFFAFDGPNGVGKSTLINEVSNMLQERGIEVLNTSEPSTLEIGKFTRRISEYVRKETLACLVAADRYEHINKVIQPALDEKRIVLCDRYIASSLVLQGIDGVDEQFILNLCNNMILPDIYFILIASPYTIRKRLKERENLTRFERESKIEYLEVEYFKNAVTILENMGIEVYEINTDNSPENCIQQVLEAILVKIKQVEMS